MQAMKEVEQDMIPKTESCSDIVKEDEQSARFKGVKAVQDIFLKSLRKCAKDATAYVDAKARRA
eukprot:10536360-Prorocentrum_lima.AAC.1